MPIKQALERLTISQRTLASVCLFSLPLGVLFYFNLDQLSANIVFASQELDGNRYQRPLVQLVHSVSRYQQAQGVSLASAERDVDSGIAKLAELEKEVGAQLGFDAASLKEASLDDLSAAKIQTKWQGLKALAPSAPAWSIQGDSLVADLRGMIGRAGDMSNLTLDPEMDSYYLADVTSVVSAQALNRLRTTVVFLESRLQKQATLSAADCTQVAIYAAAIKESDYDRITGDLDTAFRENAKAKRGASPTLRAKVQPAKARYEQTVPQLLTQLNQVAQGKPARREELRAAFAQASQVTLELSQKTVAELDHVLQARIDGYAQYRAKLIAGTVLALLVAGLLFVLVVRSITGPLQIAVASLERVAQGDLSCALPTAFAGRGDEIGQLSRSIETMLSALRTMVTEITGGVHTLSQSSAKLLAASGEMTAGSRDAADKANTVAAAAEEMSSNATFVAAGMGEAAGSLSDVATSTEQMTSTIGEIAASSEKARAITAEATRQAQQVTSQIQQLGLAAREIGRVTEAITEISSQTNLLALNATIEAARAGAAGKGFAVVANEIKALAQQTAAATEDIRTRIGSVQTSTAQGVGDVEKMATVIGEVNQLVTSIAAAIEEQATVTKDIAHSIGQASQGVQDANSRVAESSQASSEIARDIVVVNRAARNMAGNGDHLRSSAAELANVSERLELAAGRFHI